MSIQTLSFTDLFKFIGGQVIFVIVKLLPLRNYVNPYGNHEGKFCINASLQLDFVGTSVNPYPV